MIKRYYLVILILKSQRFVTIICRLLRFKDKQIIIQSSKKLKNADIFIYEDFCKDTMDLPKQLWEKAVEHRANSKISYSNYQSIVVRN